MKKGFFSKICEKCRRLADAVKGRIAPFTEFLASGRLGGIIAMIVLASQFDIIKSVFDLPLPKPLTM